MLILNKKLFHKRNKNSGFTLIELLISSFIGVVVIGAAGFGVMTLLKNSKTNTAQSQKRTEFNRAMEFISDEMRQADHIDVDPTAEFDKVFGGASPILTPPANAQPVLAINIPGVSRPGVTGDSPILYFVSEPSGGDAGVWNGPRVIYRYGPAIRNNGTLNNSSWDSEPLVDGISSDTVATACDAGFTKRPAANARGFYACIKPIATTNVAGTPVDETKKGETAKLFAIGKLEGAGGSDNYQANTQVYARAEEENLKGEDPDEKYKGRCSFSGGAFVCSPSTPGTPPEARTYSISRISDAFACKPNGTKWEVLVTAYYIDDSGTETYFDLNGGSTSENVDLSTTSMDFTTDKAPLFRVTPDTANSSGCTGPGTFEPTVQNQNPVDSTSPQFKLLEDADEIPAEFSRDAYVVDGTGDAGNVQQTAKAILSSQGLVDSIQTDRINTGNDYLVAFEIGQTDPTVPGYDFQDQMFKINVE